MNIAKYSLENTKVVYFFLAILLVGGVLSFDLLGKKEDSPFVIKTAVIITRYPGATPNEVEQLITEPIEREIQPCGGYTRTNRIPITGCLNTNRVEPGNTAGGDAPDVGRVTA